VKAFERAAEISGRGGRKVPKRSGGIALPDLDADYDPLRAPP